MKNGGKYCWTRKRKLGLDKKKASMSKSETQQEADCMKNKRLSYNKIDGQKASKASWKRWKSKGDTSFGTEGEGKS